MRAATLSARFEEPGAKPQAAEGLRRSSTLGLGALSRGFGFLGGGALALPLLAAGGLFPRRLGGCRGRKEHAGALFGLVHSAAEFLVALALFAPALFFLKVRLFLLERDVERIDGCRVACRLVRFRRQLGLALFRQPTLEFRALRLERRLLRLARGDLGRIDRRRGDDVAVFVAVGGGSRRWLPTL
jgi:hypothetical protein